MKRYHAKETGPRGTYFNLSSGEFVRLEDGHSLPGKSGERFIKVPSVLAVVSGPFAGLLFVIFLPMVGIIGAIGFIGYLIWKGLLRLTGQAARATRPEMEPSEVYPTGQNGGATHTAGTETWQNKDAEPKN